MDGLLLSLFELKNAEKFYLVLFLTPMEVIGITLDRAIVTKRSKYFFRHLEIKNMSIIIYFMSILKLYGRFTEIHVDGLLNFTMFYYKFFLKIYLI